MMIRNQINAIVISQEIFHEIYLFIKTDLFSKTEIPAIMSRINIILFFFPMMTMD